MTSRGRFSLGKLLAGPFEKPTACPLLPLQRWATRVGVRSLLGVKNRPSSKWAQRVRFSPASRLGADIPACRRWGQELTPPERTPPPSKRTR